MGMDPSWWEDMTSLVLLGLIMLGPGYLPAVYLSHSRAS